MELDRFLAKSGDDDRNSASVEGAESLDLSNWR